MNPHATIFYDYHIDLAEARKTRTFGLKFCSCVSFEHGLKPVRFAAWQCQLPDPNAYTEDAFGTSETRGIVGGIAQPLLAKQSEAIERALGDALVLSFVQILDRVPSVKVILVRGPAFPKTLGRFLSIRPDEKLTIAWVMSLKETPTHPIPMLFPLTWYAERSMAWDSEALINSFTHPDVDPIWAVEFLNVKDGEAAVTAIRDILDNYKTNSGEPRDFWCAEKLLCDPDALDYVFSENEKGNPPWMSKALLTEKETPVKKPKEQEFHGRNLSIFPWRAVRS